MKALSQEEIENRLTQLKDWKLKGDTIKKTFSFKNFIENFGFMTKVAMLAEKQNHHPDWSGGYNTLTIQLSTHDAGGISEKDFMLAEAIDKL
jgi:4a-hydroxytetrahydrobiopterin dehydratase